ncbi:MAG: hypothetical protein OHK0046_46210 [Anaerolineae bacterium]
MCVVEQVTVVADAYQPMYNLDVETVDTFAVGDGGLFITRIALFQKMHWEILVMLLTLVH